MKSTLTPIRGRMLGFVQVNALVTLIAVFFLSGNYLYSQTVFRDASNQIPPEPVVTDPSQGPQFQTNTQDAVFIDIEGDGDLDVYLAVGTNNVFGRENRLLMNDGNANFTDVTSTHLPPTSNAPFPPGPAFSGASDVGDVDNDGDPDIVVANLGYNTLILNNGDGTFTDASHRLPPPPAIPGLPFPFNLITTRPVFLDINLDGRLDLILTGEIPPIPPFGPAGLPTHILIQQPSGFFVDETATRMIGSVSEATLNALVFDADGDGDMDFIEANIGQNQIYINNGAGYFYNETSTRLPVETRSTRTIAIGDIDRDGDLDFIAGNSLDQQNQVFINDGNGVFSDETSTRMPVVMKTTSDAELFDIDYDGDLDLLCANSELIIPPPPAPQRLTPAPGPNRLYLNDGSGVFSNAPATIIPEVPAPSFEVDFADLNGDGLVDIFVSNSVNTEEQMYLYDIPPPSPAAGSQDLRPVLQCVTDNFDGSYTAVFGYENLTGGPAYIPHGNKNNIVNPNGDGSLPPRVFLPGGTSVFSDEVFTVNFTNVAVWNLNGRVAMATRNSPGCGNMKSHPQPAAGKLEIFPNPSNGMLFIKGLQAEDRVNIYDLAGRQVHETSGTEKMNLAHLEPGVYFIQVNGTSIGKWIRL